MDILYTWCREIGGSEKNVRYRAVREAPFSQNHFWSVTGTKPQLDTTESGDLQKGKLAEIMPFRREMGAS